MDKNTIKESKSFFASLIVRLTKVLLKIETKFYISFCLRKLILICLIKILLIIFRGLSTIDP